MIRLVPIVLCLSKGCVVAYDVGEETDTDTLKCAELEMPCGDQCANIEVDPDNCGGCGAVCGPGFACDRGECRDSCRNGRELCGRYCIDATVEPQHCGGCDMPCGDTEGCVEGECEVP